MTSPAARRSHTFRCMGCHAEAEGMAVLAGAGLFEAEWYRPPTGWWMLACSGGAYVRCPACLTNSPA